MRHRRSVALIALGLLAAVAIVSLLRDARSDGVEAGFDGFESSESTAPVSAPPDPLSGVFSADSHDAEPAPLALAGLSDTEVEPSAILGPSFTVRLRIVDRAGLALREAEVQWAPGWQTAEDRPWDRVGEDAAWSAAIPLAQVPVGVTIRARAEGFQANRMFIPTAVETEFDLGELALDASPRVSGVVLDASRRPVAGARVLASARGPGRTTRLVNEAATTDPAGEFSLDLDRVARDLSSFVIAWDAQHGGPTETVFVLDDQGHASGVEVVISSGVAVTGTVVDERGEAVRNASVRAMLSGEHVVAETLSGVDGEFRLELSWIEGLRLEAHADGYLGDSKGSLEPFSEPVSELVLRLWPRCDLNVRATDAISGEPIPEFEVYVNTGTDTIIHGREFGGVKGGHDGVARLTEMHCGDWSQFSVSAPNYWPASYPDHDRWPDSNSGVIELALQPREFVTVLPGRVLDAALAPVAGAEVFVLPLRANRSETLAEALTNESGEYAGIELPEGDYRFFARKGGSVTSLPLEVTLGANTERFPDLILRDAATLRGRVVRDDGLEPGALMLSLVPRGFAHVRAERMALITEADGSFVFEHVAAGDWSPSLSKFGAVAASGIVMEGFGFRLEPGETREVEMALSVPRFVHARLTPRPEVDTSAWTAQLDRRMEPPSHYEWSVQRMSQHGSPDLLDADGRVVLGPVSPGVFTLKVSDESGEVRASAEVVVGPSMTSVQEVDVPLN